MSIINPNEYKESLQPKFLQSEIIHQKKQLIFKVEQTVDYVFPNQDYKYYIYIKNISGVPIHNIHIKINHPSEIIFNDKYEEDFISIDKLDSEEVKFIYLRANCQATGKHYTHFICYGDGTGLFYKTLKLNCSYTHTSDNLIHRLHVYDFTPYEDAYMMEVRNFSDDVTQLFKKQKLPFKAGEQPFAMQIKDSESNKEPFSNVEQLSFLGQNDIAKNTKEHVYQYITRENFNKDSIESYEGKNLRELVDQINEHSHILKAKFLKTGTNKLRTDFKQYEPNGFIHRFGLLNSEIYHYLGTLPTYSYMSDYLFRWAPDGKDPLNLYPQKIAMHWNRKKWSGRGWIVYRIATPAFIESDDFKSNIHKRWEAIGHFNDKRSAETCVDRQKFYDNTVASQLQLNYKRYDYHIRESYYDTGVFYIHIPIDKIPSNFYLLSTEEIEALIQRAKPFGTKALIRYMVERTFNHEMEFTHYPIFKPYIEIDASDIEYIPYFIQSKKYKLIQEKKCGKIIEYYGLKPNGLTTMYNYPFEADTDILFDKIDPTIYKADITKELINKNIARCKSNKQCVDYVKNQRPYPDNTMEHNLEQYAEINSMNIDNNLRNIRDISDLLYQNNFNNIAFHLPLSAFKQFKPKDIDRQDSENSSAQQLFSKPINSEIEETYKTFSCKLAKADISPYNYYFKNQGKKVNTFKIPISKRIGINKENGKIGIGFVDGLNKYHLFSLRFNDIYQQDYLEYGTIYNNNFKLKKDGFGNSSALIVKFMNIDSDLRNTIAIFFTEEDGRMHYFYHIICPNPSELFIFLSDNLSYIEEYATMTVQIPQPDGTTKEKTVLQYVDENQNPIPNGKKTYYDEDGNIKFGTKGITKVPIDISEFIKYSYSSGETVTFETPFFDEFEKYETNIVYEEDIGESWKNLYRINKAENSYTYINNKTNQPISVNNIILDFDNINLPEKAIIQSIKLKTIVSSSHTKGIYCESSYQTNHQLVNSRGNTLSLSSDNRECYHQNQESQYYYYKQLEKTNNPDKIEYFTNLINKNIIFDEGLEFDEKIIIKNPYWIETTQFTDIPYDCNEIQDIELVIEGFNYGSTVNLLSQLLYESDGGSVVSTKVNNGYFYKKISLPFSNSFLMDLMRLRFRFEQLNNDIEIFNYYLNVTFKNKQTTITPNVYYEETDDISNRFKNIYYLDLMQENITAQHLNNGLSVKLCFDDLYPGEEYKIYSNELEIKYKIPEMSFVVNKNKFYNENKSNFISISGITKDACLSGEFYTDANYFSQIHSDVNADNLGLELRDTVYQAFRLPTDNITAIMIHPNGFKGSPDANLKLGIYENRGTTPGKLIKEVYASGWTKSNKDLKNLKNIKYEINVEELKPNELYWFKLEVENPTQNNYYLLKYTTTQRGECKLLMKENNNYINMSGSLEFSIYSKDLTNGFSQLPTMQDYLTNPYIQIGLHRNQGTIKNLSIKRLSGSQNKVIFNGDF